jgi:hypothetical protein
MNAYQIMRSVFLLISKSFMSLNLRYWNGVSCIDKKQYSEPCQNSNECSDTQSLFCINGTCMHTLNLFCMLQIDIQI